MAVGGTLVFIAGGFDLSVGVDLRRSPAIIAAKPRRDRRRALGRLIFGVARRTRLRDRQRAPDHARARQRVHRHARDRDHHQRRRAGDHDGQPRLGSGRHFTTLGSGRAGGIQYPVFVWLAFARGLRLPALRGRRSAATSTPSGGNAEAAPALRRAREPRPRVDVRDLAASAAGIAGVILVSEVSTAQWDANQRDRVRRDHGDRPRRDVSLLGGEGAIWRSRARRLLPAR